MRISLEGKIGIGLGLVGLAGGGAIMLWPTHLIIGWGLIGFAGLGLIGLAFHHLNETLVHARGHNAKILARREKVELATATDFPFWRAACLIADVPTYRPVPPGLATEQLEDLKAAAWEREFRPILSRHEKLLFDLAIRVRSEGLSDYELSDDARISRNDLVIFLHRRGLKIRGIA